MRKIIVLCIMLLFLGMTISSSTGLYLEKHSIKPVSSGNILYVGGNGTGNYSKIQDAINDSDWHDTVFVYNDSSPYCENVVINKNPIQLIGENKETTIIDGSGIDDVVLIDGVASDTTVSGFTIQNSGNDIWDDAGIDIHTECNTITGNIIINNSGYGIYCGSNSMPFTDYNIISENIITKNERDGIVLDWSYNNEIYDNYVAENNEVGIFIGSSELPTTVIEFKLEEYYNNIYRNTVIDNYECGIKMCLVSNTNIFNNNVTNNKIGVLIDAPINVETTDNNIYENNIMNNKVGVAFTLAIGFPFFNKLSSAKNNKIYNNNFIGNKNNADNLDKNIWESNYWDDWIGLRFKILGFLPYKVDIGLFSFAFDWRPAQEPYGIGV